MAEIKRTEENAWKEKAPQGYELSLFSIIFSPRHLAPRLGKILLG